MARSVGPRLAYVVVPIEGTVKREKIVIRTKRVSEHDPKDKRVMFTQEKKTVEEPGGYMVYFPRGHALRLRSREQLRHYHLDQRAAIVNLQGLVAPEVQKLMLAQDEGERENAFDALRKKTMALATAKSGPNILTREVA